MTGLKQSELNSIREVAAGHQTVASKLSLYAENISDPGIKQMFSKASSDACQSAKTLIQML